MIKVIKENTHFRMICTHCDSEFTYDLSDVFVDAYREACVICPCCKEKIGHSFRLPSVSLIRED